MSGTLAAGIYRPKPIGSWIPALQYLSVDLPCLAWSYDQGSAIGIFILIIVVVIVWVGCKSFNLLIFYFLNVFFLKLSENASKKRVLKNKEDEEKKRKRILVRNHVLTLISLASILTSYNRFYHLTKTRFQTDTLKSLCDWLANSDSISDWLGAPFS